MLIAYSKWQNERHEVLAAFDNIINIKCTQGPYLFACFV